MGKHIIKIVLLCIFFFFLAGCFEQEIIINDDLTGQIIYRVTYYNEFDNFVSYLNQKKGLDLNTGILFDRNSLADSVNNVPGLNIVRQTIQDKEDYKYTEVILGFRDISKIPDNLPSYYFPVKIYETNSTVYCSTVLSLNNISKNVNIKEVYNKLPADEKKMIDSYVSIMKLKFIFKTTRPIAGNNLGKLTEDKKTLIYETSVYDLLNVNTKLELSFYYKAQ